MTEQERRAALCMSLVALSVPFVWASSWMLGASVGFLP